MLDMVAVGQGAPVTLLLLGVLAHPFDLSAQCLP